MATTVGISIRRSSVSREKSTPASAGWSWKSTIGSGTASAMARWYSYGTSGGSRFAGERRDREDDEAVGAGGLRVARQIDRLGRVARADAGEQRQAAGDLVGVDVAARRGARRARGAGPSPVSMLTASAFEAVEREQPADVGAQGGLVDLVRRP